MPAESLATLVFSNGRWLLPAAGLVALAAVVLALGYRRTRHQLPPAIRRWSFGLKLAGFILLALCLLQPEWVSERAEPGANLVAVLVDNSRSLDIRDDGSSRTRAEELRDALTEAEDDGDSWLKKIAEDFTVRRYRFDSSLTRATDFTAVPFDGEATSLHGALDAIAKRYDGRPLAAIVVLTDGNETRLPDPAPDLANLPPVYPVVIGDDAPGRDLSIDDLTVTQTVFEDAPVTLQIAVRARGYKDEALVLRLLDKDGIEAVASERFVASGDFRHSIRFLHRPTTPGLGFHRLALGPEMPADPEQPEATLANNERFVAVNRGRGPYRVLYVCGRPNWEYKFLHRALADDPEIEMPALVRIAKREPKFSWRGRDGESSNPLFRGFRGLDGEEQRYDEPVLKALNVRDDGKELRNGFPRDAEACFVYDAIIVDDLEAEFFTTDQMDLLQEFVSRRGGGFLMLGGMESFAHGNYRATPVGAMLPVHLEKPSDRAPAGPLRFDLSREGWLEPWARLRENRSAEESRLNTLPPTRSLNLVQALKPGASLVATAFDGTTRWPALATQRYGDGRAAAFLVGDAWRWGFKDPALRPDADKAWRQIIRWLVADVPRRVTLTFESDPDATTAGVARLQARVLDPAFRPLNDAKVVLTLTAPTGDPVTITPRLSDTQPGVYEASFIPQDRSHGWFRAEATALDGEGQIIETVEEGWTPNLAAEEFRRLEPNRDLLARLAAQSGGEVYAAADLDKLARKLPTSDVPVTRTLTRSLWHTPLVFILALGCFGAEWILRRARGLA